MAENKIKRRERLRAMREKYGLGEYRKNRSISSKRRKIRGVRMARRRKRGGGSSFGVGGLLSTKNILGTLAGAYLAPKVGISPQIGAAAGSYLVGKKGIVGAAVGYVAAPYVLNLVGGIIPSVSMAGKNSVATF